MKIEPLGDQAVLAYCKDEEQATRLAKEARRAGPAWCVDVVQAYVSVAVYYDISQVDGGQATDWLAAIEIGDATEVVNESRLHVVPCCYEMGLDFERIHAHTGLARDAVVVMHTNTTFTVYAIGFCPGFPYLGYLPAELAGVPRLESPRLRVQEGSVGLTGRQTGIYTLERPGGWNIIGRTPLKMVDVREEYFPLRTGDRVRFTSINAGEFERLRGRRLTDVV